MVMDFPPKSNDLNIIENVWGQLQKNLDKKIRNKSISSQSQLLTFIESSWKEIPASFIRSCILSMPNRLEEVITMQGKPTQY